MRIGEALKKRKTTYRGIGADVGEILDNYNLNELLEYFVKELGSENLLRTYLVDQIINNEIIKDKTKRGVW